MKFLSTDAGFARRPKRLLQIQSGGLSNKFSRPIRTVAKCVHPFYGVNVKSTIPAESVKVKCKLKVGAGICRKKNFWFKSLDETSMGLQDMDELVYLKNDDIRGDNMLMLTVFTPI